MSNENGLRQSPFGQAACPTPDAMSGDQGTGGGFDPGPGGNGLTSVPWKGAFVPTPTQMTESGQFGNPSRFSSVNGSTEQNTTQAGDITSPPTRTLDKR